MGLRDIGSSLPPGFRFYPSDEELVCHYLFKKVANEEVDDGNNKGTTLVEINLHTCEPWQLPEMAKLNSTEWYFFSFRDRKYATGFRANRATSTGYWKATGKDRTVCNPATRAIVGMRKTLVFYQNRAPNGIKTGWIMHEFRLENPHTPPKEDWVLCRVFHKGKGEDTKLINPQNELYEFTTTSSFASPDQNFPWNYYQTEPSSSTHSPPYQSQNSSAFQQHSPMVLNPSFRHFSNESIDAPTTEINSACAYECGFLFDMDYEETKLEDGAPTDLEEIMRFGDDNSLVFL